MCVYHQQGHDHLQIDARFWRECSSLFIEDKILLPKKKTRHLENSQILGKSALEVIWVYLIVKLQ